MSTHNEENLVSVEDINESIEKFIGKHPENISMWIDGKNIIIQISNIGIRDKLFSRLAYLVENTSIEDNLTIFNMPAKCVNVTDRIARFVCTVNELVTFVESNNSGNILTDSNSSLVTPPVKKFLNRLTTSKTFKRAQTVVKKLTNVDTNVVDRSKITVYIIGKPTAHWQDENEADCSYVTWEVLDIIQIDAGTTWNDEEFRERLSNLKNSLNIYSDLGDYGTFNIAFNSSDNVKIENNELIGKLPEFILDPSVKVGDIIDSRDYTDEDIWTNGYNYQTNDYDYQQYYNFSENTLPLKEIDTKPYGETLIPDGAIITI